jgi:hypothetical protein
MIATDLQHYPNPDGNMDLFNAEWETLTKLSRTSQFPERASLCDGFEKSETRRVATDLFPPGTERDKSTGLANDWAEPLGSEQRDLVLNNSSLTEYSCLSLHSEFDFLEEGILSTVPFDEEAVDSRDGVGDNDNDDDANDDEGTVQSHDTCTVSGEQIFEQTHNNPCEDARIPRAENIRGATGERSISYAQLFFDPETKALVTLMEIANDHAGDGRRRRASRRSKIGNDAIGRSHLARHKNQPPRGTPLHRSPVALSKNRNDDSGCKSVATRDNDRKTKDSTDEWDVEKEEDRPFQDETLSTECSSLSSETCRKHDYDDHNFGDDDDWGFPTTTQLFPPSPTRFSIEPIVFSNDGSMEQKLCWLDEADIGLYLLQDCDDPWDYGGPSKGANARCGDSLKKLLNASRLCMPLAQLGESKWRASSSYLRPSDLPTGNHHNGHHKAKLERTSYSILNDV